MTPTARTLAKLRADGWTAQVVEKWNPHSRTRLDLFGIIDVLACHPELGIMGVQATSGANVAARMKKALGEPRTETWLRAGGLLEVWGWAKQGPRGKRKVWTLRWLQVRLKDLVEMKG